MSGIKIVIPHALSLESSGLGSISICTPIEGLTLVLTPQKEKIFSVVNKYNWLSESIIPILTQYQNILSDSQTGFQADFSVNTKVKSPDLLAFQAKLAVLTGVNKILKIGNSKREILDFILKNDQSIHNSYNSNIVSGYLGGIFFMDSSTKRYLRLSYPRGIQFIYWKYSEGYYKSSPENSNRIIYLLNGLFKSDFELIRLGLDVHHENDNVVEIIKENNGMGIHRDENFGFSFFNNSAEASLCIDQLKKINIIAQMDHINTDGSTLY